jgi:hypothetical protein
VTVDASEAGDKLDVTSEKKTLVLEFEDDGGLKVRKELVFEPQSYLFTLTTSVSNGGRQLKPTGEWGPGPGDVGPAPAGVVDPGSAETIASQLEALAAEATDLRPAYGAPRSLATLARTRAKFFGGGCIVEPEPDPRGDHGKLDPAAYDVPLDFYAAYHVPFFATYAACEKAAYLAATGDRPGARKLLTSIADRGKNRTWLLGAAKRYE